ncbi:MAG: GtrA family protein [Eggerthellaceae bacterium]
MGKLVQQFMKFGVVGIIAFGIDYGLLAFLTEVFGINYLISATISFTVSVIFNYVASMRYVFTHKEGLSRRREFVIFVVLSVIGLLINNLCMWAGVELLGIHYLITKIGATALVSIWNFVTRKIFLDAGDQSDSSESPESEASLEESLSSRASGGNR